jgi:hypothetical protein
MRSANSSSNRTAVPSGDRPGGARTPPHKNFLRIDCGSVPAVRQVGGYERQAVHLAVRRCRASGSARSGPQAGGSCNDPKPKRPTREKGWVAWVLNGARGGSRTHTEFPPEVFETSASAIPPLGLCTHRVSIAELGRPSRRRRRHPSPRTSTAAARGNQTVEPTMFIETDSQPVIHRNRQPTGRSRSRGGINTPRVAFWKMSNLYTCDDAFSENRTSVFSENRASENPLNFE